MGTRFWRSQVRGPCQFTVVLGVRVQFQTICINCEKQILQIQIICVNNEKVGTVQIAITEREINLKQLYILPNFQYRGTGGEILRDLKIESNQSNLPITLRVLQVNSAKEFYLKNGFTVEKETAERMFLRYTP